MKLPKFLEKRASKINIDKIWQWPSLEGIFSSNKKVTEWKALQMSAVYACIRLISNTMAMMPISLHQQDGESSRLASEKPLNNVLYRLANPYMTAFLFKQTMFAHVLMFGNAYAEKVLNGAGDVIELWPLAAWKMDIKTKNGKRMYILKTETGEIEYNSSEILHIPGLSFDGIKGYSPIQVMKNEVSLGLELQSFGEKFFKNGTHAGSWLQHPGRLGEKARQHLKEDIENNFTGSENALKIMILEEAMTYNKIGIPNDDAQFVESRKFQLEEICRFFGVQLHMIQNLDKASFNNIEQQGLEFKMYCLGPWATIFEQEVYKSLLNDFDKKQNYYAKFNFNALLKADYKSRMEGYRTGVQMGLYSLNEIRKFEDMNPMPDEEGGNIHFINSAMVDIKSVINGTINNNVSIEPDEGGEDDGKK